MTAETVLAVLVSFVFNPLSMLYAIRRNPFGWVLVIIGQALFASFAVASGDWRWGGQGLCLLMGIYGTWRWYIRRDHEPAIGDARERYTVETPMGNTVSLSGEVLARALAQLMTRHPREVAAVLRLVRGGASTIHPQPVHTPVDEQRVTVALSDLPEVTVYSFADRQVAEDAIAALNHFDRRGAQELRERLEANRA